MGCVLYTQRVEIVAAYEERRDCAHQNIPRFIKACGYLPIPLPNIAENIEEYFSMIKPKGIIMTGGNSMVAYGGNAPEKDETDFRVIELAIKNHVPIYAFCRGMQSILCYFENQLNEIPDHVGRRHEVLGLWEKREVNSFHQQGVYKVTEDFEILAQSLDGVVEAVQHRSYPIIAVMWHPERETVFSCADITCVKKLFL